MQIIIETSILSIIEVCFINTGVVQIDELAIRQSSKFIKSRDVSFAIHYVDSDKILQVVMALNS